MNNDDVSEHKWMENTLSMAPAAGLSGTSAQRARAVVRLEDSVDWRVVASVIITRHRVAVVVNAVNHHLNGIFRGTLSREPPLPVHKPWVSHQIDPDQLSRWLHMCITAREASFTTGSMPNDLDSIEGSLMP